MFLINKSNKREDKENNYRDCKVSDNYLRVTYISRIKKGYRKSMNIIFVNFIQSSIEKVKLNKIDLKYYEFWDIRKEGKLMSSMSILNAPFIQEMMKTSANMYRLGWDERNGGNISYLLTEKEVKPYLDLNNVLRTILIDFDGKKIAGKLFVVTGSGEYFKNIIDTPEKCLGIIRISSEGNSVELLWGFSDGGSPTSELPSHLMSHISRLDVDPENRIVMHCHASHLLAMTFTHSLDERAFTRTLWQMCTECIVVFPEGVGIIPWIIPGTNEIGKETSLKMKENRLVVWPHHGIYGSGKNLDEAFGLIETAEKAAQTFTYVKSQGNIKQTITDRQLQDLADGFKVVPKAGYLSIE